MMRVANRNGQRIGGIFGLRIGFRQQHANHHADLRLLAVTGADDRLFHQVRGIFCDSQPGFGRHQHRYTTRLSELEGRGRIGVHKCRFDRRFVRPVLLDHREQPVMNCQQADAQIRTIIGFQRAASDMDQPIAVGLDQAPAGAAEPRIDAENANRVPGHHPVDSPRLRPRLACFAPQSARLCGPFRPVTIDSAAWAVMVRLMPKTSSRRRNRRAVIIGGSMSGLFSAAFLRQIGWDVDVYERSSVELVGRGAGITGHPELMEALEASGAGTEMLGIEVPKRIAIDREGRITDERPLRQVLTSWDRLQRLLRATIDETHYHLGWNFERVDQDERGVRVQFSDGRVEHADVLIGGDGIRSSVRAQMAPEVQPVYAGYYIWRGAPNEADLAPETLNSIYP